MEENKVATDSSAPNSPELTRLSGEQAEERAARESRLRAKYNCVYAAQDDFWMMTPLDKLDARRFGTICLPVELYHAISECPRLASRVEELEKLLREMVKKHGVHSGECFSCDYFVREAGRHNAACLIPIAEDLLAGAHAEEKSK